MLTLMLCGVARAASFDCDRASTRVEHLVCDDEHLSELDSQLGRAYQLALRSTPPARKATIIAEESKWIDVSRNDCGDIDCLRKAYPPRIASLAQIQTGNSRGHFVVATTEVAEQSLNFQRTLKSMGLSVAHGDCPIIVRLDAEGSSSDASYGAICEIGARPAMVCDDSLIGKLTVKFEGFAITGAAVADFTASNCAPGGG